MPADATRREAIAAAVETYSRAHPEAPLPRPAVRLLGVMFSTDDVCRQSLEALIAEGFSRKTSQRPYGRSFKPACYRSRRARRASRTRTALHLPMPVPA